MDRFWNWKALQVLFVNDICENLGESKSRALLLFHAFTGSDTTSQFFGKGKRNAWDSWKSLSRSN